MTLIFPLIQVVVLLACLPAYRVARRQQREPAWSLFLIAPALLTWIGLTMAGIGSGSQTALVELFDLSLGTIVLYYMKVFFMDRSNRAPVLNSFGIMIITVATAALLRFYMPGMAGS